METTHMFPQELTYEQQLLQTLWQKYRSGRQKNTDLMTEQVQYVRTDGWWVLSYDGGRQTYDVFFLGRSIEEAQHHLVTA